jgi:hypothetical protein
MRGKDVLQRGEVDGPAHQRVAALGNLTAGAAFGMSPNVRACSAHDHDGLATVVGVPDRFVVRARATW